MAEAEEIASKADQIYSELLKSKKIRRTKNVAESEEAEEDA